MSEITRQGSAQWEGDLKRGQGTTSTGSGRLKDVPYSVLSRFESGQGTNPEELIAAAHAACFSMMLAKILGDQQFQPKQIRTQATVTLRRDPGGPRITRVHLSTEISADGLDEKAAQSAAEQAKEQCPVSVLLKPGLDSLTFEAKIIRT